MLWNPFGAAVDHARSDATLVSDACCFTRPVVSVVNFYFCKVRKSAGTKAELGDKPDTNTVTRVAVRTPCRLCVRIADCGPEVGAQAKEVCADAEACSS